MKNIKAVNMVIQILLFLQYITTSPLSHEKCTLENSDCLKTQAQATLHAFVQGIPELGVKKLDKLHLGDTNVKTADVSYQLRNTEIGGFNNTIIDDLSIHMPFKLMRLNFHTTLKANSDYKVDGSFFGLPVTGEGKCEIFLHNLQMEMIMKYDIIKNEQGKDIMDITNYFYGADVIDGAHTQLTNLFNGDKEKSDAFHEMFNKFWRTIVSNFGRYFTSNITKEIFEAIQTYMRSRPLEEFAEY